MNEDLPLCCEKPLEQEYLTSNTFATLEPARPKPKQSRHDNESFLLKELQQEINKMAGNSRSRGSGA